MASAASTQHSANRLLRSAAEGAAYSRQPGIAGAVTEAGVGDSKGGMSALGQDGFAGLDLIASLGANPYQQLRLHLRKHKDVSAASGHRPHSPTSCMVYLETQNLQSDFASFADCINPYMHSWCRSHNESLLDYCGYFDFKNFTREQRQFALKAGVPEDILRNALNQSRLLSAEDIEAFDFGTSRLRWKLLSAGEKEAHKFKPLVQAAFSHGQIEGNPTVDFAKP
eukprot:1159936-Pelagomonas_calceolata.AAC.12